MKVTKITFLIIFSLTICFAKAQYKPMLKNGAEWYTHWSGLVFSNSHYMVSGDSIVNSINYKKILNSSGQLYKLFREDSINKKVFELSNYDSAFEYVIYDYNLSIGDTFSVQASSYILKDKGNINLSFADYRDTNLIVFEFSPINNPLLKLYWIESIGESGGFYSNDEVLLCHYSPSNVRDYWHKIEEGYSDIAQCEPVIPGSLYEDYDLIKINPNPFTNWFTVVGNSFNPNSTIRLTDLVGKVHPIKYSYTNNKLQFDGSSLSSGIYILDVEGVGRSKIIKK